MILLFPDKYKHTLSTVVPASIKAASMIYCYSLCYIGGNTIIDVTKRGLRGNKMRVVSFYTRREVEVVTSLIPIMSGAISNAQKFKMSEI